MTRSYFIIGTDTNVGKTYVASALVRHFVDAGFKTVGMKPIASGCELNQQGELLNDDVVALSAASNVHASLALINPYSFVPAIAPHIAAEQAGVEMRLQVIADAYQQLKSMAEIVIVEGAGGFLVPINQQQTLADLAVKLDLPIILVVGMRLGCINHALLTVEAIQVRGLKLAGWVANEIEPNMPMFEENLTSLQQRISAPCLSVVRWQGNVGLSL
ncbi:MAG TPA: dethiobiotin synthase [Methylotenera sp.]|nr:dethiobiotin synthase [Methylotenera sp.]